MTHTLTLGLVVKGAFVRDGLDVGIVDGDKDGDWVGEVGARVGSRVGISVGAADGKRDGNLVGAFDGDKDGEHCVLLFPPYYCDQSEEQMDSHGKII